MPSKDPSKCIQIPVSRVSAEDLIRQLSDDNFRFSEENFQLRQAIDKMANTLAMQNELIQQLRDEIARLKGEKPKPDIRPSTLEGQSRKTDWRKRISRHDGQMKTIEFSLFMKCAERFDVPSLQGRLSTIATTILTLQNRPLDISRLARGAIKKVRVLGKPGQPKGKPRKKKNLLYIHEKPQLLINLR